LVKAAHARLYRTFIAKLRLAAQKAPEKARRFNQVEIRCASDQKEHEGLRQLCRGD
jgi:hypothetical protein